MLSEMKSAFGGNIKKILVGAAASAFMFGTMITPAFAAGGFDQFGYNDTARIFSGPADGVDGNLDGTVWGDPTYANDHLVMKWNAAWDACNDAANDSVDACLGAWTTNEWNGMNPDGSKSNWHYKIIWVGSAGAASPYWVDGGYLIWGNYETISDQGVDAGVHAVYAQGIPNGLGN